MEKKNLKQKWKLPSTDRGWKSAFKRGTCAQGCDLTKGTCEHIEDYLSENLSVYAEPVGALIDQYPDTGSEFVENEEARFVEMCLSAGLTEQEMAVTIESVLRKRTYSQIKGIVGVGTATGVFHIKKRALKKLKDKWQKII